VSRLVEFRPLRFAIAAESKCPGAGPGKVVLLEPLSASLHIEQRILGSEEKPDAYFKNNLTRRSYRPVSRLLGLGTGKVD
jgi:hypothetical protein